MTQKQNILKYMLDNGSITPVDAIREFGCMRLAARIADLKEDGYDISGSMEKNINRYGETVHYSRYTLKKEDIYG